LHEKPEFANKFIGMHSEFISQIFYAAVWSCCEITTTSYYIAIQTSLITTQMCFN